MIKMNENFEKEITLLDSFTAIFYLVWVIAKQQWKLLISLMAITLLMLPAAPLFFSMNEDYKTSAGLIAGFAILPSLLILFVFLPTVNNQISSSSIQKRMNATGVSSRVYNLVMIISFAALALVAYYFMIIISILIYSGHVYEFSHEQYIMWNHDLQWLALLTIVPISFIGLSSTGVLIGKLKMPEIAKGVVVFLIIVFLLSMSRTVVSPYDMIDSYWNGSEVVTSNVDKAKKLDRIFLYLNPWGTMVYTIQYGMTGGVIASTYSSQFTTSGDITSLEYFETAYAVWKTLLYAVIWSGVITSLIIWKQ